MMSSDIHRMGNSINAGDGFLTQPSSRCTKEMSTARTKEIIKQFQGSDYTTKMLE